MNEDLQKELAIVRQRIDRVDGDLLELLNQRARYAQQVGQIKARHGEAGFIYRPEREAQVLHSEKLGKEVWFWINREALLDTFGNVIAYVREHG